MHQLRHQPLWIIIEILFLLHTRERESLKVLRIPFHFLESILIMKIQQSTIELCNLSFHAYHGVLPHERLLGNTFTVDITLETDFRHAIDTDELCGTINYAEAYEVVKSEMNIPSQLLEHVCGRIGTALLDHFPTLQSVLVRIAKHNPPIEGAGPCLSAVTLKFSRED